MTHSSYPAWRDSVILAAAALAALHLQTVAADTVTAAEVSSHVRTYREQHEPEIVREFARILAIPNHASDAASIRRNAVLIAELLRAREIDTRLLELDGAPPIVFGKLDSPGATTTITFYAHYDGQPATRDDWQGSPFQPTLRASNGTVIDLDKLPERLDPESRLFARSSSDDKAPVIATLAAIDALRAARLQPAANLRFFFEGEEEVGSPRLARFLQTYARELQTDLWVICDGPVHQNGQKLVYFGVRGAAVVDITVYGPNRGLHSGHYGNWAPNPIVLLTHLLDSMRDTQARILIPGFYDDVRPISAAQAQAARAMPNYDAAIKREFGIARTEAEPASLQTQLMHPALNIRGISGGRVGPSAANVISPEATASIDFRLVPDQTPQKVQQRVEQHIARQGYHIVREPPDAQTRAAHPLIARLSWDSEAHYPAARTPLDEPLARRTASIVEQMAGAPIVVAPALGGSVPMHIFKGTANTPVIGVPIANYDNNQHAANENLRLQNLWDAIEIFAGLFVLHGAAQATIPAQFVSREDGGRIAYYPLLQAKTVPVFVLSGGPGTNSHYMRARGALDRLAQTRSMIFFDQRGTSRSSDTNGNESIDQYVEDIEAIRKAVGAPQVDLLGHSFGGYLAIAYTSKYPQHVRGLVFVDSAVPKLGDVTQLMDQVFPDRIGEWREKRGTLGKQVKAADVVVFQSMEFVDEVALREFLDFVKDHTSNMDVNNALRKDMAGRDYWDDVKRFKQPALVVHGRFDVIVAPSDSWKLHQALPNSRFHVIEAAGHLPHIERPDAFLAAVQPFLEALDR